MDMIDSFAHPYVWPILLISYCIGSVPFGLLFTRFAKLGNIRKIGSGNIGATNVLRTGNKKIAALTLICDTLKGTLSVLIAQFLMYPLENLIVIILAGFLAFLGHLFPIWLKFKGGKGVATYWGVCLGLYWPAAIVFIVIWIIVFLYTHYSSLSALITVIVVPVFVYFFCPYLYTCYTVVVMSAFVIVKHHANIGRLLSGKENKNISRDIG